VGLPYKDPKGGIGAVIQTYSHYFSPFQFIATYKNQRFKPMIVPYFIGACLKLGWVLGTNRKIRVVHIHGAAKGSLVRKYFVYAISKRLFGKKVVYHSHGSELKSFYEGAPGLIQRFVRHFLNHTDEVICLSAQWEGFFKQHFRIPKISILENIVEEPISIPVHEGGGPLNFLFLGAIGNRKGIFDLLAVLSDHKAEFRGKLRLTIGGGGENQRLEDFINQHGLSDLVRFEGWVKGERKQAILAQADVYILPSYNEGLPISILEAMSYHLPIISTPVGGTPEVVREGQNGFLVEPGDQQGLYGALTWFIEHPDKIRPMGTISAEIVRPYYARNVIPKLTNTYIALLS
jgi:glycosyltransferase involved in cell wall biosynthesis